MPFTIVRQDITKMQVDAVVNAANTKLLMGGGVCGAIFKAAGEEKLKAACDKLSPINYGEAVITRGYDLPSKYIIHAAGPVFDKSKPEDSEKLLRSAYLNSLRLAEKKHCESIAFPLISSGTYGYPKEAALAVASSAIKDFLKENDMDVYLAVFDKAAVSVSERLLGEIESYIDDHYAAEHSHPRALWENASAAAEPVEHCSVLHPSLARSITVSLDDVMDNLDEPFNVSLMRLIDAKGKTDAEVYKKANIDRKLFSKIRKGKGYMPSKKTVLALAVALELTLPETDDLLEKAGFALSHSQKFDVIVEYFIVNKRYDIFEINEVLFKYDQPLLGAV